MKLAVRRLFPEETETRTWSTHMFSEGCIFLRNNSTIAFSNYPTTSENYVTEWVAENVKILSFKDGTAHTQIDRKKKLLTHLMKLIENDYQVMMMMCEGVSPDPFIIDFFSKENQFFF
jgi:hypothetical protein